jgi:glycosyltransferase involved in cell wall biosynthesis
VYSEIASRRELAGECSALWRLKRRLILSDATSARDLEHYRRRMPERVNALVQLISDASGLTAEEVLAHPHVRHAFSFARMAECWRADYIHTYFFYERTLFALVASHLLGIPRGVSCYADHMLNDYALKLVPLHLRSCDVIVATSARIKRELESLAGRPLSKSIVKPNAIDTREFAASERSRMDPSRACRLVSVSRIHPKKGLTYLIDATRLLRERGLVITLLIAGDPDESDPASQACHEALKQRIATNRLEAIVRLEGWKTGQEVRRSLADADIFVAPYVELPNADKDGIPTALLEAMAAGCAVVTTDAGSILEVIDDGIEGLIVPQSDAAALADAIARLIQEDGLRSRISRAAADRVRRQFDISRCESGLQERVRAAIAAAGPHGIGAVARS